MREVRLGPSGDEGADEGTLRADIPVGRTNCRHAGNVGNHLAPDAATGSSTTDAQLSRGGSRGHEAVPGSGIGEKDMVNCEDQFEMNKRSLQW